MGCPNNGYLEPNLDAASPQELKAYLEGDIEGIAVRRFGNSSPESIENAEKLRDYAKTKLGNAEGKNKKLNKIYNELPDIANW